MPRTTSRLAWWAYLALCAVLALEAALRVGGYRPYRHVGYTVRAEPPGAYTGHERFGLALAPGRYTVRLGDSVRFTATHGTEGCRTVPGAPPRDTAAVGLFGCSFTYGYGVDDTATFAARLQAYWTDRSVHNHGVPGHGTAQALLRMREAFGRRPYADVVLTFSPELPPRDAMTPAWRRALAVGYRRSRPDADEALARARFPWNAGADSVALAWTPWADLYRPWPGWERSAAVYWAQGLRDAARARDADPAGASAVLLRALAEEATAAGARCWVLCLAPDPVTRAARERCAGAPLRWIDLPFDFTDPALTLQPHDHHPDAAGHAAIAAALAGALDGAAPAGAGLRPKAPLSPGAP